MKSAENYFSQMTPERLIFKQICHDFWARAYISGYVCNLSLCTEAYLRPYLTSMMELLLQKQLMTKSGSLFSAKKTSSKMFGRFLNMSLMQLYTVFIDRSLTGHSIYLLVQVNILRFKYSITIRSSVTGKFMSLGLSLVCTQYRTTDL